MRFLANAHPRVEQRVQQVLTAMLLVAAGRGLALVPASAASLHVEGVVLKELVHGGGDTQLDADPERPVELHAIWSREPAAPVVRRVLWRDRPGRASRRADPVRSPMHAREHRRIQLWA